MLSIHGAFKNKGPVGVLEQQITLLLFLEIFYKILAVLLFP